MDNNCGPNFSSRKQELIVFYITGQCQNCAENMGNCDLLGFYAFAYLNGTKAQKRPHGLYLHTNKNSPFCATHYRVTIVLSDTLKSLRQGGDRGNFRMILNGENGSTLNLLLNKQETYFEPGRTYHFITITTDIGNVQHFLNHFVPLPK